MDGIAEQLWALIELRVEVRAARDRLGRVYTNCVGGLAFLYVCFFTTNVDQFMTTDNGVYQAIVVIDFDMHVHLQYFATGLQTEIELAYLQ